MLEKLAEPCGAGFVKSALQSLVLVFGVAEGARSAAFWNVYIETLDGVPREALDAAIREYAALPDSQFFPKPGPLKALAVKHGEKLRCAAHRAARLSTMTPIDPTPKEDAATRKAQVAEILAGLGMRPNG
jgi:hypothetical protein